MAKPKNRKPPPPPPSSSMKKFDLVNRGEKKPTLSGTLTFVGLRALDLPLQYALLAQPTATAGGWGLGAALLSRAGVATASGALPLPLWTGLPAVDALGHPTGLLLLAMAVGSAAKQVYWQVSISAESLPARAATAIAALNTVLNSANALLFLSWGATSLRSRPSLSLPLPGSMTKTTTVPLSAVVGAAVYAAGLALETASERQRKAFKDDPRNAGKVCKVGAWRWARHVNYLGYALWRGGYAMAAGGWVAGLLMTAWQVYDLSTRAAGVLDEYCSNKYKEQWARYKREVPYKIIPGVY
ncbi:hypothetical protein GGR52DRAFT_162752 [Hypoxylon sp. FL1284]|nr:hypothetical protein GGR52DRAFT_162752 [Hypoxylon sp. FL1284]